MQTAYFSDGLFSARCLTGRITGHSADSLTGRLSERLSDRVFSRVAIRRVSAAVAAALLVTAAGIPTDALAQTTYVQANRGLPDFSGLFEAVSPSVVNISVSQKVRRRGGFSGFEGMDPRSREFFERFFGEAFPGFPRSDEGGGEQEQRSRPSGVGSGFILSQDGYIMTNAHVVDGADEVTVKLADKREFKATVVGKDKHTDVAVVKIQATDLPAVRIGNVDHLRVGQWVAAIGSPFGLENTITAGIVSAKKRETGDYLPFIQTDVAVNPGNSGGPLINMRGEVVGINSQIYSRSGGYMGISFAIPIDEAIKISDQLRETGRVQRGRLGVEIGPVSKELAESLGLPKAEGALVSRVEADTPADKAGLKAGDVITAFNGRKVEKVRDLPRMVGSSKPGSAATVTVYRRGKTLQKKLKLGEFESDQLVASRKQQDEKADKPQGVGESLGLAVSELDAQTGKELLTDGGVMVDYADGAAARAGIREGDVIVAVGNTDTPDVRAFEKALARAGEKKPIRMLLRRGDMALYVFVRP